MPNHRQKERLFMFRFMNYSMQPYMEEDTGTNLGGGGNEPTPNNEPIGEPTPTPTGGEPTPTQQSIKVKFNHQEMDLPYEEAVTHIQKGMNYEKAVERAKQEARDAYVAEQYQGQLWNDKPITTESELKQALKEQEIYNKYQSQGLPEEVIQELVESKRDREERKNEKLTIAEQNKKNAEYSEFLEYFRNENGREFDVSKDNIPKEIWGLTAKGKTLTDAYTYHLNSQLKAKIAEYEKKIGAQETNDKNASSTPGSVTGNGSTKSDFISFEAFEANKHDQKWVVKNLDQITKDRTSW